MKQLIVLLICIIALCKSDTSQLFSVQSGQGTYYGPSTNGHCTLDTPQPSSATINIDYTVAMNTPQYANSEACGMCALGNSFLKSL